MVELLIYFIFIVAACAFALKHVFKSQEGHKVITGSYTSSTGDEDGVDVMLSFSPKENNLVTVIFISASYINPHVNLTPYCFKLGRDELLMKAYGGGVFNNLQNNSLLSTLEQGYFKLQHADSEGLESVQVKESVLLKYLSQTCKKVPFGTSVKESNNDLA